MGDCPTLWVGVLHVVKNKLLFYLCSAALSAAMQPPFPCFAPGGLTQKRAAELRTGKSKAGPSIVKKGAIRLHQKRLFRSVAQVGMNSFFNNSYVVTSQSFCYQRVKPLLCTLFSLRLTRGSPKWDRRDSFAGTKDNQGLFFFNILIYKNTGSFFFYYLFYFLLGS